MNFENQSIWTKDAYEIQPFLFVRHKTLLQNTWNDQHFPAIL